MTQSGRAGNAQERRRRGQGTLEYIMLLTVILLALVVVMSTAFSNSVNKVITESGNTVNIMAGKIKTGLGL